MGNFGLVKSFGIDNGELGDEPQNSCFVLGYELGTLDILLKLGRRISTPVHAMNRNRITKSCQDERRKFTLTYMHDDVSEEWMHLEVEPTAAAKDTP